ncbi:MAG: biotin--[acetyl-CoA-carboxylase] ligase [Burkholderiaceae bacterium]
MLNALQLQSCLSQNLSSLALPWEVEVFDRIDSTSSELMRQAKLKALAPKVLVSLEQTHGRGRAGKTWISNQEDSLTFSIGLLLKPLSWLGLSLCVGIDLAHSLDPDQCLDLKLKWPNDVWVYKADRFHKLAGILIETIHPNPATPLSTSQAR